MNDSISSTLSELLFANSKQLTSENVSAFLFAGNATFTLVSKKTGKRFTYKLKRTPFNLTKFYLSVLTGPENSSDFEYLGLVNLLYCYQPGNSSRITRQAPSNYAIIWFMHSMQNTVDSVFAKCEVWHEGKCGRCGRKLTVPSSIESGIGPECASKM